MINVLWEIVFDCERVLLLCISCVRLEEVLSGTYCSLHRGDKKERERGKEKKIERGRDKRRTGERPGHNGGSSFDFGWPLCHKETRINRFLAVTEKPHSSKQTRLSLFVTEYVSWI